MPVYTVVAQLRNFFSASELVPFEEFQIRSHAFADCEVGKLFGPNNITFEDCFYVRSYHEKSWIAPQHRDHMIRDVEDAILLLRLFRRGELGVVSIVVTSDDGEGPSKLCWNPSMSPDDAYPDYEFGQSDVEEWKAFSAPIRSGQGWNSAWFGTARRFFAYGAAIPVEEHWGHADRYVYYSIALEAPLVPERDNVGRRLRRRAAALLSLSKEEEIVSNHTLRDLYDLRSTTAHGRELSVDEKAILKNKRQAFEDIIRRILATAVQNLPGDEAQRDAHLKEMYDLTFEDRAELVLQHFNALPPTSKDLVRAKIAKKGIGGD